MAFESDLEEMDEISKIAEQVRANFKLFVAFSFMCVVGPSPLTLSKSHLSESDRWRVYLKGTHFAGNVLEQRASDISRAMYESSSSAVLFTRCFLIIYPASD